MRHIGRDSETPGKFWGFVILRLPSDFASLNSEFVNHSQGKIRRASVGVFHETDQRVVARREVRGEDATTTGFYLLEPAPALARRRSRRSAGLKGAQNSSTDAPEFSWIKNTRRSCCSLLVTRTFCVPEYIVPETPNPKSTMSMVTSAAGAATSGASDSITVMGFIIPSAMCGTP